MNEQITQMSKFSLVVAWSSLWITEKWETSMLTFLLTKFQFCNSVQFYSSTSPFFCTHANQSSPKAILHKVTAVHLNHSNLIVFPSFSDRHMFSGCIRNRCTYCLPSCSNWGLDNTSCLDSCIIFEVYLTSVVLIFLF